jgi:hypothetical protein
MSVRALFASIAVAADLTASGKHRQRILRWDVDFDRQPGNERLPRLLIPVWRSEGFAAINSSTACRKSR